MTEGGPFQEFPSYVHKSSSKKKIILPIAGVGLLLAVGGGIYFLGVANQKKPAQSPVPAIVKPTSKPTLAMEASPSAAITAKPTQKVTPTAKLSGKPTPTSDLERSKLRIAILNGSGVAGAAKDVSANLTNLGYTIATIGNADDFTYKNITIKIKKSKSDYLLLLKNDIEKDKPDVVITTKTDDMIDTDAEVIVGK
jgi:hypothetical protein